MAPRYGLRKVSLGQGLDKEVYQIVRKLIDGQDQYGDSQQVRLSVTAVYEKIKRSNSSLNRKNKRLLEDSIERVLELLQKDASSSGSIDGDFDNDVAEDVADVANGLNKNIVSAWSTSSRKSNGPPVQYAEKGGRPEKEQSKKRSKDEEPPKKKRKANPVVDRSPPTHVSLANIGGMDSVVQELGELLIPPFADPEDYAASGESLRGILLHGPPGCGKTFLANVVAAELGVPFIAFSAPSIVSGMSGESESALRELFEEAKTCAPCLIFIDEIDAITQKRENAQGGMEKRIVAQLLTCMDDLSLDKTGGKAVIVMAATNRPDSLDSALRRGDRFDEEIYIGAPNEAIREHILRALTRKAGMAGDVDFRRLARLTSGFVGADLKNLLKKTHRTARRRCLDALVPPSSVPRDPNVNSATNEFRNRLERTRRARATGINRNQNPTFFDWTSSLSRIQPSLKREGFASIPSTTFSSIGALKSTREALQASVVAPILDPEDYASDGISAPPGVLLWGPPGCGKTLLAKAVANACGINFISVSGAEMLDKFVGESEKAVRKLFSRARDAAPVMILFDELDALMPNRDEAGNEASARVVNTLLSELDGLKERGGIYVLGTTNRPQAIDPAILRSGRLEARLYVGLPGAEERVEIMQTLVQDLKRKAPRAVCDAAGNWEGIAEVARKCEGFSGADLARLLRSAVLVARGKYPKIGVTASDLEEAKKTVGVTVQDKQVRRFEKLRKKWVDGL